MVIHTINALRVTFSEVVQAINKALRKKETIVTKRLYNGDTIITFYKTVGRYKTDESWIKKAFNKEATKACYELTMIVKRLFKKSF